MIPSFVEIAAALKFVADDAKLTANGAEELSARLSAAGLGVRVEAETLRRRARALAFAHDIFSALARYEPEVLRLAELSKKNAGRSRLFSRSKSTHKERR